MPANDQRNFNHQFRHLRLLFLISIMVAFGLGANFAQAMGKKEPKAQVPRNIQAALQAVRMVVVESVKTLDEKAPDADRFSSLISDAVACGVNASGPLCLSSTDSDPKKAAPPKPTVEETSDSFLFVSRIGVPESAEAFLQVLKVPKNPNLPAISSVAIYASDSPGNDLSSARKLAEFVIPEKMLSYSRQEFSKVNEGRRLFHLATYLLGNDDSKGVRVLVLKRLRAQFPQIVSMPSIRYQTGFLLLVHNQFPDEEEFIRLLADFFQYSSDADLSQLASLILADEGEMNVRILNKVRGAVRSGAVGNRIHGIEILSGMKLLLADQNLIISCLGAAEPEVRGAALKSVSQMKLGNQHLPQFQALLSNTDPAIRLAAVNGMAKLETPEANMLLLERLADDSEDVRKAAYLNLRERKLSDREVPELARLLSALDSNERQAVLALIEQIGTPAALRAICLATFQYGCN